MRDRGRETLRKRGREILGDRRRETLRKRGREILGDRGREERPTDVCFNILVFMIKALERRYLFFQS